MTATKSAQAELWHHQIEIEGASIHVVQGGSNQNPSILFLHVWHFVPEMPEKLIYGRERLYFDYFFNLLAGPNGMSESIRERFAQAYNRMDALRTGFQWYATFRQDVKDNTAAREKVVDIPVLYLRGDAEKIDMEKYLKVFHENGLKHIEGSIIPDTGHFSPCENPDATIKALQKFITAK